MNIDMYNSYHELHVYIYSYISEICDEMKAL